jgi:hypothetical protein
MVALISEERMQSIFKSFFSSSEKNAEMVFSSKKFNWCAQAKWDASSRAKQRFLLQIPKVQKTSFCKTK